MNGLALTVLADRSRPALELGWDFVWYSAVYSPQQVILSILMVSRIPYPSFGPVTTLEMDDPCKLLGARILPWYSFSFINAWFLFDLGYLTVRMARAG